MKSIIDTLPEPLSFAAWAEKFPDDAQQMKEEIGPEEFARLLEAQLEPISDVEKSDDEDAWSLATADIDVWAEAEKKLEELGVTEKQVKPKRGRLRKDAQSG